MHGSCVFPFYYHSSVSNAFLIQLVVRLSLYLCCLELKSICVLCIYLLCVTNTVGLLLASNAPYVLFNQDRVVQVDHKQIYC